MVKITINPKKLPNFDRNFEGKDWIACVQSKISLKLSPATIKCHTWLESCQSQPHPSAANFYQYAHREGFTIKN